MSSPDYRFAVVCTHSQLVPVNNFVMVFAFTKAGARLHKAQCQTGYEGYTFDIKPVRKEENGTYTILD